MNKKNWAREKNEHKLQTQTTDNNNYLLSSKLDRIMYLLMNKFYSKYLTIKEAAIYLRVSQSTIRRLIDDGHLSFYKINDKINSKIIINTESLENYLEGKN